MVYFYTRMRRFAGLFLLGVLLSLAAGTYAVQQHVRAQQRARASSQIPRRVLWVWERPEDLRSLALNDAGSTNIGVAVLDQTIRLGASLTSVPRSQPFILPHGIARIAVVRMEPQAGFAAHMADSTMLSATVDDILVSARQPGIAALQIDFDATRSQRGFYRSLLHTLRDRMPPALPLTITALASWCSQDDWLADLPIDEATPMFFRMEPDRRRLLASAPEFRIREPLCMGSVGVSTREPWPQDVANKRIYLFADAGWAADLPLLSAVQDRLHPAKLETHR